MSPKNQPVCVSQLPAFSSDLEHEKRLRDSAENLRLVREEKQRILLEAVVWRRKITEAGDVFTSRMAELETVASWPREDLLTLFGRGLLTAAGVVQKFSDANTAKLLQKEAGSFLHKIIVQPAIEKSRNFEAANRAALEGINWETMPSRLEVEPTADPHEGVRRMIGLRPGEKIAPGPSGVGKYLGECAEPFTTWGGKYADIFKG